MARLRMPGSEHPITRRLPWMMAGDAMSGIFAMLTFFGSVFVLFLAELGLDKTRIGVLLSLVPFCGIFAAFVAPLVSRWGFKRTAVLFWGLRHVFMALVLLTPALLRRNGLDAAYTWTAVLILLFGLFRATAEIAFNPWIQEIVPDSIRGKFYALNSMTSTIAQMIAVGLASRYIEGSTGTNRYMVLIGVGSAIGACSALCYAMVPGGAPAPTAARFSAHWAAMRGALRERSYVLFLIAVWLVTVALAAMGFVPLYMQEQIGISTGNVLLLTVFTSIGSVLSSYLWGSGADRLGSRPIMRWGIVLLLLPPISWLLMPRQSAASQPLAFAIALLQGVGTVGWQLASTRFLYVYSAHSEQRVGYITLCYVISQLGSGVGPMIAGRVLDAAARLRGSLGGVRIDAYSPIFVLMLATTLAGYLLVRRLASDSTPAPQPPGG